LEQGPLTAPARCAAATLRGGALTLQLLAACCCLPAGAGADTERIDLGAWSSAIPDDPGAPCELTTGGYDHAAGEQNPLLLIGIDRSDTAAPLRVHVMADTDLTPAELLAASARLRVDGPQARTLPLLPAAIVETDRARRVTFRPRFRGSEQQGLRALVDALRSARRVSVEVNGRALEPAFSMQGLDTLWQQAAARCGQ
jgi:hypothetical protein